MAAQKMILFCFLALLICPAQPKDFCSVMDLEVDNMRKLTKANNHFAINLYKKLASLSGGNFFFSPLALSSALGMLFYGAKGDTAQEFRQVLGYNKANMENDRVHMVLKNYMTDTLQRLDQNLYNLSIPSALLVSKVGSLHPNYRANLQKIYQAYVEQVDFGAGEKVIKKVNEWVTQQTRGNIPSMVENLDPSSTFLLLSGAYFKAKWKYNFDHQDTRSQTFYNNGQKYQPKDVSTMHMVATLPYGSEFKCQVLELPFADQNISMLVLLPDRGHHVAVERGLTQRIFYEFRSRLSSHRVILALPRFRIDFSRELSDVLKSLGMTRILESTDDYCGMSFRTSVRTEIRHKAVVNVQEDGTEPAAMTAGLRSRMMPQLWRVVPEFIVNRPFLFAVVENSSGMILFIGRVVQFPECSEQCTL